MRKLTFVRTLLLALCVPLALASMASPASAQISVGISVHVGPPALPVYVQPPCPTEGYLWTPGYWAYGDAGYYWVPGVWVAPPRVGLLWTPGYWGFAGGVYGWHAGYWGPHIGFYGGVNYGFGYGGVGFVGGEWRGGHFAYNTAVVNVNTDGRPQHFRQPYGHQQHYRRQPRQLQRRSRRYHRSGHSPGTRGGTRTTRERHVRTDVPRTHGQPGSFQLRVRKSRQTRESRDEPRR